MNSMEPEIHLSDPPPVSHSAYLSLTAGLHCLRWMGLTSTSLMLLTSLGGQAQATPPSILAGTAAPTTAEDAALLQIHNHDHIHNQIQDAAEPVSTTPGSTSGSPSELKSELIAQSTLTSDSDFSNELATDSETEFNAESNNNLLAELEMDSETDSETDPETGEITTASTREASELDTAGHRSNVTSASTDSDAAVASPPVQMLSRNALTFEVDSLTGLPLAESRFVLPLDPTTGLLLPNTLAQVTPDQLQPTPEAAEETDTDDLRNPSYSSRDLLGSPLVAVQGVYALQGEDSSGRVRVTGAYAISPNVLVGGTLDWTAGEAFSDSREDGVDLNELYITVSPPDYSNLRLTVGMVDLTSYFDRNSFAKDAATQFLNPVFQSNPALTAAGLGSRPAILLNWSIIDPLEIKVAGFSSNRDLGEFALDGFAAELGFRVDNFILRGTYITGRDSGQNDGFQEIFQFNRGGGNFGLRDGDREAGYGLNAEWFIPELNLGLFGRYGWYENLELNRGGETFSVGFNLLDLFMPQDRLGLAYGQQLSNSSLREDAGDNFPDVWELFYDVRITPNLRAGFTVQSFEGFSETIAGLRVRVDFDSRQLGRLFQ